MGVLLLVGPLPGARAAPGAVDSSFGIGGRAVLDFGPSWSARPPTGLEAEATGAVRVTFRSGQSADPLSRRYLADGSLDGSYVPRVPPASEASAVQPDGKIVQIDYEQGYRLTRYNPDGSLDAGFGSGGHSPRLPLASTRPIVETAPSGAIFVAGSAEYLLKGPSIAITSIAKLRPDGSLDPAFGNGGVAGVGGSDNRGLLRGLAAQGDSPILSIDADYRPNQEIGPQVLIRLTPAGLVDAAFGDGGVLRPGALVPDLDVLADGRIAALLQREAGRWGCCTREFDLAAARYTPDGQPDTAYGDKGVSQIAFGPLDELETALWGADGSAIIGGSTAPPTPTCRDFYAWCSRTPALYALSADGSAAPSFSAGSAGFAPLAGEAEDWKIAEIVPRPTGGYFVAGSSTGSSFLAARLADGSPDPGFAGGGVLVERLAAEGESWGSDVAVAPGNEILVSGSSISGRRSFPEHGIVAQLTPAGAVNQAFGGGDGLVRVPGGATRISVDAQGRVLALGADRGTLTRITREGSLDQGFGEEGFLTFQPGDEPTRSPRLTLSALAALPDGGAIVAGAWEGKPIVFRIGADGRPDPGFASGGAALLPIGRAARGTHGDECIVRQVGVQRDGRILLAGGCPLHRRDRWDAGPGVMFVGRLLADGRPDPGFGRKGRRLIGRRRPGYVTAFALWGEKILLTGTRRATSINAGLLLMRMRGNGRLDRSFGDRGVTRVRIPPRESTTCGVGFEDVSILPTRGRIVVTRSGPGSPVLAFGPDGRRHRRYATDPMIARNRIPLPGCFPGPAGAMQAGRPIIAWTTDPTSRTPRKIAVQRLAP